MSARFSEQWVIPVVVVAACAAYTFAVLDRGWIPHDEGTLAQSAERVLAGELPHRDFDEGYTGGLSFLNAAAFQVLGISLWSLRIPLFLVFLLWVPSLYYVSTRFVSPRPAGATVLLAVAWSLPSYTAPMPSWYNLYLSVFAAAALCRYVETRHRKWLVVAGACAGLSCVVKITGLYLVAAILLVLAFEEQRVSALEPEGPDLTTRSASTSYRVFSLAALLTFLSLLLWLIADTLGAREAVHFVLPSATLVGLFLWTERSRSTRRSRARFAALTKLVGPCLAGFLVPIAVFMLPFITSDAVFELGRSVFVQSLTQLSFGHVRPPSLLATSVATIPLLGVLGAGGWRYRGRGVVVTLAVAMLAGVLVVAPSEPFIYRLVWYSVRGIVPVVTLAGAVLLARSATTPSLSSTRHQQLLILLCVMVMVNLVQFPFSSPIYFFYVAPVIALAATALVAMARLRPAGPATALGFYVLFAGLFLHGASVYTIGFQYTPAYSTASLALERGGLRVSDAEKNEYEQLVALVNDRAAGRFIYATPDCPEVYFLSATRNPTPTFFEYYDDQRERATRILNTIDRHQVPMVVVNQQPSFSGTVPNDLLAELEARFPHHQQVGRFEVRWQDESPD